MLKGVTDYAATGFGLSTACPTTEPNRSHIEPVTIYVRTPSWIHSMVNLSLCWLPPGCFTSLSLDAFTLNLSLYCLKGPWRVRDGGRKDFEGKLKDRAGWRRNLGYAP